MGAQGSPTSSPGPPCSTPAAAQPQTKVTEPLVVTELNESLRPTHVNAEVCGGEIRAPSTENGGYGFKPELPDGFQSSLRVMGEAVWLVSAQALVVFLI